MENKLMIINNFKNDLTNMQNELVEKSFTNICSILDIKKLSDWIKDNRIHSIIIFGSRTRLHETSSSDLDLLITDCDALDDVTDDNYLCKQKEIVDYLYKSFKENILINKDIELDFKLNINRFSADYYNGIDANSPVSEENDFYFEYEDIPSYFEIYKDRVEFEIISGLKIDDVFTEDSFKNIDLF